MIPGVKLLCLTKNINLVTKNINLDTKNINFKEGRIRYSFVLYGYEKRFYNGY